MKALTISPFYACAIMWGEKTIEVRTWKTDYRGDIIITSSAKKIHDTIPGHALCIANLYDVRPIKKTDAEQAMIGKMYIDTSSQFSWCLQNIRLIEPTPIKGKLSLWNCDIEPKIIMSLDELNALPEEEDNRLFSQIWEPLYV